jgi:hypothetical protein
MLVPLPPFALWLHKIEKVGGFLATNAVDLHSWDIPLALTFIVLGAAAAVFIRIRRRFLKVGTVITLGIASVILTVYKFWGDTGLLSLLGISFLLAVFLLIPAFLEAILGHGEALEGSESAEMDRGNPEE